MSLRSIRNIKQHILGGWIALLIGVVIPLASAVPVSAAPGDYHFDNMHSWLCLDVVDWGAYNGANVQQWGCARGWPAQQWYLADGVEHMDLPSGTIYTYYLVRSRTTGRCLDVAGWSTSNGANVQVWDCHGGENQRWAWMDSPRGYGTVALRAMHSDKCLEVYGMSKGYGGNVVQWDCWNGNNQIWYWRPNP